MGAGMKRQGHRITFRPDTDRRALLQLADSLPCHEKNEGCLTPIATGLGLGAPLLSPG